MKIKLNFRKFGLYVLFLISFSVVVYSIPNPGHALDEIQGYFSNDADLSVSIPKFQSAIGSCTGTQLMTGINPDGTVICDDLKPVWVVPTSIISRSGGNGDFTGYDGMATKCTGANEHVCDAEELTAYSQVNGDIGVAGWYNTGTISYDQDSDGYNDCRGWTNSGSTTYGAYWNNNKPSYSPCNQNKNVLCCKY
ncbi:hypothetical protein HN992_03525 [Candidatus Woesearchaeota archaeon]|nr:hypothetical protein [Candidatus Woesearchaeota archaeon]